MGKEMASRIAASATVRAVKGRKLIPTRAAIVLTPSAITRVKELFEGKDYAGLKIESVSEAATDLATLWIMLQKKKSLTKKFSRMVYAYFDVKAQLSLLGTEMDYVENELSAEFVFNNPNIKGTCGCGESFSV